MQHLEVSGAVRHIYRSLGVKGLISHHRTKNDTQDTIASLSMKNLDG